MGGHDPACLCQRRSRSDQWLDRPFRYVVRRSRSRVPRSTRRRGPRSRGRARAPASRDVRAVVERGHHHLVPVAQHAAERSREREVERGHARAERDLLRCARRGRAVDVRRGCGRGSGSRSEREPQSRQRPGPQGAVASKTYRDSPGCRENSGMVHVKTCSAAHRADLTSADAPAWQLCTPCPPRSSRPIVDQFRAPRCSSTRPSSREAETRAAQIGRTTRKAGHD